jgi:Sel1 repeat
LTKPQAQYDLSVIYGIGEKVPLDYGRAIELLTASAESGYPGAQYALGNAFYLGHMAQRKDYVRAYAWFNVYVVCTPRLRWCGKDQRAALEKLMTPEQVAEAQSLSKALLAKIQTAKHKWTEPSS